MSLRTLSLTEGVVVVIGVIGRYRRDLEWSSSRKGDRGDGRCPTGVVSGVEGQITMDSKERAVPKSKSPHTLNGD